MTTRLFVLIFVLGDYGEKFMKNRLERRLSQLLVVKLFFMLITLNCTVVPFVFCFFTNFIIAKNGKIKITKTFETDN